MFLRGKKILGKSIKHPLANSRMVAKPDSVRRLLSGDKEAIPDLLSAHMNLIISIASKYAAVSCADKHDLVSVGIVAAIEACSDLVDDNITILITSRVHAEIAKYVRRETTRQMARLTDEKAKQHPFNLLEIEELLDSCIKTPFERDVISYKRLGFDHKEIAELLGSSRQKVELARKRVRERYYEKN